MRVVALLTGTLALVPLASYGQSDWVDIKDPTELRALYSNKTFKGNGWIGHYRADGTGVLIVQGGQPVRRTWQVKGNDQVCATPETGAVRCAKFMRSRKDPRQVLLTFVPEDVSHIFTVEDGVPKF